MANASSKYIFSNFINNFFILSSRQQCDDYYYFRKSQVRCWQDESYL